MNRVIYTALCVRGKKLQRDVDRELGRTRGVARLLLEAEEKYPAEIDRYRDELNTVRVKLDDYRGTLMQHVAHCTAGCARDASQGLSASAFQWDRAPANTKRPLPSMEEIAGRLRNGEALEAIADEYDRHRDTLKLRLQHAGFSSRDGRPARRPSTPKPATGLPSRRQLEEQPWRANALCSQTDPEAFFPEKGGATAPAKAVCASCAVAAECLDWALENNERFGIWGGLSERERRRLARQQKSA